MLRPPDDNRRSLIHIFAAARHSIFFQRSADRADDAVAFEPVDDESYVLEGRSVGQNRPDFFVLTLHDLPVVHNKFKELTEVALELLDDVRREFFGGLEIVEFRAVATIRALR